jgi:hypothetical protein
MRVFFDAAEMQARGTPPEELKKTIQERYKTHYYNPPDRAGVSYMLSPVLRTYVNPDQSEEVATANVPHVMHYAPNVSANEIGAANPTPEQFQYFKDHGRWPDTPYPILILHGPHGYMVQFQGVAERDAITREYTDMLAQLCKIKGAWCLPRDRALAELYYATSCRNSELRFIFRSAECTRSDCPVFRRRFPAEWATTKLD